MKKVRAYLGLGLLELLVAMAIFSILGVMLSSSLMPAFDSEEKSRDKSELDSEKILLESIIETELEKSSIYSAYVSSDNDFVACLSSRFTPPYVEPYVDPDEGTMDRRHSFPVLSGGRHAFNSVLSFRYDEDRKALLRSVFLTKVHLWNDPVDYIKFESDGGVSWAGQDGDVDKPESNVLFRSQEKKLLENVEACTFTVYDKQGLLEVQLTRDVSGSQEELVLTIPFGF